MGNERITLMMIGTYFEKKKETRQTITEHKFSRAII